MKKALNIMIVCLLAIAMMGVATDAIAQQQEGNPVTKGTRGLANVLTGWVELPATIYEVSMDDHWLRGITMGLGKGLVFTVGRTLAGVYDLITFPFPTVVGVPKDYESPIEPEYVFEKVEMTKK